MRKILGIALSMVLIISLVLSTAPISAMASFIAKNDIIISDNIIRDDVVEEKIICNATIEDEFEDDSIIVVFKKDTNPDFRTLTQADFPEIQVKNIESLTKELEPLIQNVRQITKAEVIKASTVSKIQAFEKLTASTGYNIEELQKIEENFNQMIRIDLTTTGKQNVLDAVKALEKRNDVLIAQPNYIYTVCATTPDDTEAHNQWAIDVLDLNEAWDITTGSSSVTVGILDSGIYCDHTDLNNNVNIVPGKDFTGGNNTVTDENGHGTHVAGIVGAEGDNGEGVAGVCWDVEMVNLRVTDENGDGTTGYIAKAIAYATQKAIPILNLSVGRGGDNGLLNAIEGYQGLLICSAGNLLLGEAEEKRDSDMYAHYPSSYDCDNIIAVAATNIDDRLRESSFYGATKVDLGAPGGEIYSTTHNGGTGSSSGTSMAAPQVTGVAALLKSAYPTLTTAQLKRAILRSVDEVSSLTGKCVTGGRLNANNALRYAEQYYKIEYNANGGTGVMADTRAFQGTAREIRANAFTNENGEFDCWHAYRAYDNKWYYYNSVLDEYGWYTTKPDDSWEKCRFENGTSIYNLSTILECDYNYVMTGQDTSDIDSTITFYAQWTPCYNITYNANGGSGSMSDTRVVYGVSTNTRENEFTRDGYDFNYWYAHRSSDNKWRYQNSDKSQSGWYLEGSQPSGWTKYQYVNGGSVYATSSVPGDIVIFYAQWKKYFIVRYDSNGAQGTMADTKVYYGVSTPTRENTFTNYGNEFDCWFVQRESDSKWRYQNSDKSQNGWYLEGQQPTGWIKYRYENGCSVYGSSSVAGDIVTFYAQWKKYYTVRYMPNGGTGSMENSQIFCGVGDSLQLNTFTRVGYDFDCWYAQRNSDSKWKYQNSDNTQTGWYTEGQQPSGWVKFRYENRAHICESPSATNEVICMYAQWKKYFTIRYYSNGGSGTMADTKVYYGVSTQLRANTFARTGYTFDCWYVYRESDGKWRYRSEDKSQSGFYVEGQQPSGWTKFPYNNAGYISATSSIAGDVVRLYAQWKKHFIVRYNANGGVGTMAPTTVVYGEQTNISVNTFTKEGYQFLYWYVCRSSDNKWRYRSADGAQSGWYLEGQQPEGWTKYPYYDGGWIARTASNPGEIVTFYAQWAQAYRIQYNANGGVGTMEDSTGIAQGSVQLSPNTFTRAGYDFGGWYVYDTVYDQWLYSYRMGEPSWYPEDTEPEGWLKHVYGDQSYFNVVSDVPTTYILYAVWYEK